MNKSNRGCALAFLILSMIVVAFIMYIDAGLARNFNNTPYFIGVLAIQTAALVWSWRTINNWAPMIALAAAIIPPVALWWT